MPPEQRRDDILGSAAQLFLEKGVEQTTIEDITRGASVSKGAFYLHFSSKGDVVEALRSRFVQELLNRIKEDVRRRKQGNWRGKLLAWARACASGYLEMTQLHDIVFAAAPAPDRRGLTSNILIDDLAEILVAGQAAQAWSLNDPALTAVFLFNALHGAVMHEGSSLADDHREKFLRNLEDLFRRIAEQD